MRRHPVQNWRRRTFLLAAGGAVLAAPVVWRWLAADDAATANGAADLSISAEHLNCIRQLRFVWEPSIESGGPAVDFDAPFGSPYAYDDLAKIAPTRSYSGLKHLYTEVMSRLAVFTEKARLEPGYYVLPQPIVSRLKQFMFEGDAGIGEDGRFNFTAEHAKLIRAIRWRYDKPERFSFFLNLSLDPQDWLGPWRVATVNFKRPFGDMTYFELDMAQALGVKIEPNSDDPEEARLVALYHQMHAALQVFVMHATV